MAFFKTSLDDLPALDAAGRAHGERVASHLAEQVQAHDGFLAFDQYMELVLYAPGLGYYSAGSEKLGAGGDFITAPLITPLFSQVLAQFMRAHMREADEILELGAGTGVMARDILASLAGQQELPNYHILEPGADLRQRQQQTLSDYAVQVNWLDKLNEDQSFHGIIVGNEVVDAMPVRRFVLQQGQVLELGVGIGDGQLCWQTRDSDPQFSQSVLTRLSLGIDQYPDGYCSEYRPAVEGWIDALSRHMASGLVVLLDYGFERRDYYQPARSNGTMRGYYRHHLIEDPLLYPGMMDLTASVDFTELAEQAVAHGFQVAGYATQAGFLIENGLLEQGQDAGASADADIRLANAEAIKLLTDPGEMGETIKVMVLAKDRDLAGVFTRDMRYRL